MKLCCPKCGSKTTSLEPDPSWRGQNMPILSCFTCGNRVYGEDKVLDLYAKATKKEVEVAAFRAEELALRELELREQRAKYGNSRCAWIRCGQPKRSTSKYCSRSCSNKNARNNYEKRRASNRKNAA